MVVGVVVFLFLGFIYEQSITIFNYMLLSVILDFFSLHRNIFSLELEDSINRLLVKVLFESQPGSRPKPGQPPEL